MAVYQPRRLLKALMASGVTAPALRWLDLGSAMPTGAYVTEPLSLDAAAVGCVLRQLPALAELRLHGYHLTSGRALSAPIIRRHLRRLCEGAPQLRVLTGDVVAAEGGRLTVHGRRLP